MNVQILGECSLKTMERRNRDQLVQTGVNKVSGSCSESLYDSTVGENFCIMILCVGRACRFDRDVQKREMIQLVYLSSGLSRSCGTQWYIPSS